MSRKAKVLISLALIVFCIIQVLPFYFAVTTAFKDRSDLSSVWELPLHGATTDNFVAAVQDGNILRAMLNSGIVTIVVTVLTCFLGAMAAYPLARRRTVFNQGITLFTLGVMMVPPLSILVPLYSMLNDMHLLNTYPGIILPLLCLALPQAIFLYSQFIRSIPVGMEEAAWVDGANRLQVFFRVILPLLAPVTATVVILTAVNVWNEFALSSYIMTGSDMRTLAPAIAAFFGGQGSDVNAAVAASLLGVVPVIIAYLFLQRYFMKGMLAGAEK
ncbi:carbohydrate ABC transporter permease [Propionibacterium freudenreichii]|uniref:carbohydrate ABC transporter permease n=1 Tax=Propionibacterium freudenreichii TaxID=1744 RepID=UPI000BC305A3|nr:carbohydrate ABC transporter permease [Propionibacterium freudenreichii]MDK9668124.1 carbohydrate ABC transporter permease [Propionibacterium freudenreichii]SCQ66083.1 AmyC [Propionibacterium freudenreichii]SCQ75746.1 AmyC [Propionibacterium freudenreichii]